MKCMKLMAIGILLLLGASGAAAQSLGDYAREVRKTKTQPSSASRHYDNDNLPVNQEVSVVGPPSSTGEASAAQGAADAKSTPSEKTTAVDPAAADAERQKTADEWKKKLDKQQEKIDSLNHELDLDQREVRLRTAATYTDPSINVNNVQWNKDDARFKNDIEDKQKALDAAQQEMNEMQETARKAGVVEKDKDKAVEKDKDQE